MSSAPRRRRMNRAYSSSSWAFATRNPAPSSSSVPVRTFMKLQSADFRLQTYCRLDPDLKIQSAICSLKSAISHARLILARFGIDANLVAPGDKGGRLDDEPGLERGRFDLRAGGRTLDSRHRLLHHEIHGRRQLDADRLDVVELHADQRFRDQVVLGVSERLLRDVDL